MRSFLASVCLLVAMLANRSYATVLFSDDFESYNLGVLDKNAASSANAAPNGSGNPWWGPGTTPNMFVVGPENGVTPQSGSQMIRGNTASGAKSLVWDNIAYRDNAGQPFEGNLTYTFWFYDPNGATNGTNYRENSAIAFYSDNTSTTDYPSSDTLSNSTLIERLTLGGSNYTTNTSGYPETYNSTEYQARVVNAQGGYNSVGWMNLPITRSVGWHEGEITVGPAAANGANTVSFYIDNLTTPLLTTTTVIDAGYTDLEFTSEGSAVGYFDDATLTLTPEPISALGFASLLVLCMARPSRSSGK